MLYHASPIGGLTELRPHISNHGIPLLSVSYTHLTLPTIA